MSKLLNYTNDSVFRKYQAGKDIYIHHSILYIFHYYMGLSHKDLDL